MRIELSKKARIIVFIIIGVIACGVGIYLETSYTSPFEITELVAETPIPTETPTSSVYNEEGKLNINKASLADLDTLPGIGVKMAERIIEYREENGGFDDIEELTNVPGMGEKTIEGMSGSICVR